MREAELKSQKTKSVFIQILTEIKQWTGNPDKRILVPAHSLTRQTDCSVFSSIRQDVVTLGPSPVLKFCEGAGVQIESLIFYTMSECHQYLKMVL